jgi:hypothetical protein
MATQPNSLGFQRISRAEAQHLLSDADWVFDQSLSDQLVRGHKVYVHANGQVMDVFYVIADLYDSKLTFDQKLEMYKKGERYTHQHVLSQRLPDGRIFVNLIDELIVRLPKIFSLPTDLFDLSLDSLTTLDNAIENYGKAHCLEPYVFSSLVAYIGEIMRLQINGQWEVHLSEQDQETWEPWLRDSEGRVCNSFIVLFDELTESDKVTLRGSVPVEINFRDKRNSQTNSKSWLPVLIKKSPNP